MVALTAKGLMAMGKVTNSREEALGKPTQVYSERLGVTRLEWDECRDLERRRKAETETGRDLLKPVEQLVCDVHEEAGRPADDTRDTSAKLADAVKRMVSMMGRVAKSNDRLAKWMLRLTWAIAVTTLVTFVLSILRLCGAI